jgi:hypothetical protein
MTAVATATAALTAAVSWSPVTKASCAASIRAVPIELETCSTAATAPPSVSRASAAAFDDRRRGRAFVALSR